MVVTGAVRDIESVFQTSISVWKHRKSGRALFKSNANSVPAALRFVVESIVGLQELPLNPRANKPRSRKLKAEHSQRSGNWGMAIPAFLRDLYNIPTNLGNTSASSICLVEFMDYSSFDNGSLETMEQQTGEPHWLVKRVIGPFGGDGLESVLDVQYGGSIARGTTVWFWTGQRWLLEFAQEFFAAKDVPLVLSMSWGWYSAGMCTGSPPPATCNGMTSQQYVQRVETEFMKMAARGITIVAASGDQGAPGDEYYLCNPGVSDIYPGSSLWATSLGATQLGSPNNAVAEGEPSPKYPWNAPVCEPSSGFKCADGSNKYEVVCSLANQALITSGGGFSAYLPQTSWQSSAVNAYLRSGVAFPPAGTYNTSNRAFPDIAALGHNYLVWGPTPEQVDGTSCSTPVFAAMVALLNAQRLARGRKPLGHVAPLLYKAYAANPSIFTDITVGDNTCSEYCCQGYGFKATKGWDAATGLGSVNFQKLAAYVATLP